MVVNDEGLLKAFVPFIICYIDLFPGREEKDTVIIMISTGVDKFFRIRGAEIFHVSDHIRDTTIKKNGRTRHGRGFFMLMNPCLQQFFTKQNRFFQKELGNSLFLGCSRYFPGDLMKAYMP
jgi:hypothetical protein